MLSRHANIRELINEFYQQLSVPPKFFFIFYSLLLLSLFFFFFFFALKGGKKKSEKLRNERQKIDLGISRNSIFCFSSFNSNVLGLEVDNCRRK